MYIYCVYPGLSKSPKQLPNCLKIAEASVVLILFNGVIFDVSAYTVTIFTVALNESGTRNNILGPWLFITEVYLTPFISTQDLKNEGLNEIDIYGKKLMG